jgi:hypothetical protein
MVQSMKCSTPKALHSISQSAVEMLNDIRHHDQNYGEM